MLVIKLDSKNSMSPLACVMGDSCFGLESPITQAKGDIDCIL